VQEDKMGEMSGLWEGIALSLLFVILFTVVVGYFNTQYDQSYDIGLNTTTELSDFYTATASAKGEVGGEVTQTSDGLTLISAWNMGKGIFNVLWGFINGAWIQTLVVDTLHLDGTAGLAIAGVLRLLFVAMLIFGIIKIFFKVPL